MGVYEHLVSDAPAPWEYIRWQTAKEYHWTLNEFDAISMVDYFQLVDIRKGQKIYRQHLTRRQRGNESR